MTRAPRSRKKKKNPATVALTKEVATSPLASASDSPQAESIVDATSPATSASQDAVLVTDAEPMGAMSDSAPSEPKDLGGSLAVSATGGADAASSRIEIERTEDRRSLGQRLVAARQARGWSREDVARRLHVPVTVIAEIEEERFERLGAPVYVRGYLSKYAQLVDLPMIVVNRAIEGARLPDLRASIEATPLPSAWDRHRVVVIGGLITLAVATSVLTLVANRGVHAPLPQVRSLDESEMIEATKSIPAPFDRGFGSAPSDAMTGSGFEASAEEASANPTPNPEIAPGSAPVMAAMATFAPETGSGVHVVEARFHEKSWFEIYSADGRIRQAELVPAGQSRRYETADPVSIKIGNAGGVEIRADGVPIDLSRHARDNVARLRLFESTTATPKP